MELYFWISEHAKILKIELSQKCALTKQELNKINAFVLIIKKITFFMNKNVLNS
jgi:hypothetical protein